MLFDFPLLNNGLFFIAQLVKNPSAVHPGLIPGSGRSPGEEIGSPLQYSGLENSMDCIVNGVAKSRTWLSNFPFPLKNSSTGGYYHVQYIRHPFCNAWKWTALGDKNDTRAPGSLQETHRCHFVFPVLSETDHRQRVRGVPRGWHRSLVWRHFPTITASSSLSCFIESKIWIKDRYW